MSRKDELLKLAQLFHSQARRTLDRPAKQALRKLGDHYQNEAKKPLISQTWAIHVRRSATEEWRLRDFGP